MKLQISCLVVFFAAAFPVGLSAVPVKTAPSLNVPAITAYAEPNPEAMAIPKTDPINNWSAADVSLAWYGQIKTTGRLKVSLRLQVPNGSASTLVMAVGDRKIGTRKVQGTGAMTSISFGSIKIHKTGTYRLSLSGLKRSGSVFADIDSLQVAGEAADNAQFIPVNKKGAPSVHLHFPIPDGVQAQWFYNEVTVRKDPVTSYFEACGFARGYFGIQVNSPTERRIIFSVWDSGSEAVDRRKVATENRVQLVAKGDGVVATDFGNEGTGGHSHLVYPWKAGETYRFLVSAKPDGDTTIYTGWFYFPEKQAWGLIASFRAPKDGQYLRNLYSFNEDFGGSGQHQRLAEFGNQRIRTVDGQWVEITKARFTHTASGYKDRLDRGAGVIGDRFFLTNGGFKDESIQYGAILDRPASAADPVVQLPSVHDGN